MEPSSVRLEPNGLGPLLKRDAVRSDVHLAELAIPSPLVPVRSVSCCIIKSRWDQIEGHSRHWNLAIYVCIGPFRNRRDVSSVALNILRFRRLCFT